MLKTNQQNFQFKLIIHGKWNNTNEDTFLFIDDSLEMIMNTTDDFFSI